ncbi:MAG: phosphoadenosine phosphosulfate reductase family protein [Anaerolineae bacterium]|nr:phosphoadenosine phosphosulfate reductase family protein [Anaerolineae bacterium]
MLTLDQLTEKVALPTEIDHALKRGFDLAFSISGGKDSDVMSHLLYHMRFHQPRGWRGRIILLHAHLGRAERLITPRYIARFADQIGLPLHIVDGGDLVDIIKARKAKLEAQGKQVPFWPSAQARYCTSSCKCDKLSAFLRTWAGKVICAMGLRAAESPARAHKPIVQLRSGVHTKTRTAYDWLPLHHFTTAEIWNAIGYSLDELHNLQAGFKGMTPQQIFETSFKAHPAYALGNERLSCGLCIFGSQGDLRNGARQNPEVYREYVQLEAASGYAFQPGHWLGDVAPELLPPELQTAFQAAKGQPPQSQPLGYAPLIPQQLPLF